MATTRAIEVRNYRHDEHGVPVYDGRETLEFATHSSRRAAVEAARRRLSEMGNVRGSGAVIYRHDGRYFADVSRYSGTTSQGRLLRAGASAVGAVFGADGRFESYTGR